MENEKHKVLPKHVKDMSQEELEKTLKKKKERNAKALAIVEAMIDNPVDKDWFLCKLKHIRQSHFQDAIEERSIIELCGYPLCCEKLKVVKTHQYHISLKTNRVYDRTERQKFCSNCCYQAANYLGSQLLTSPLWLDNNDAAKDFTLMPSGFTSSVGVEIGLGKDPVLKLATDKEFTSINQFAIDSLDDIPYDPTNNIKLDVQETSSATSTPNDMQTTDASPTKQTNADQIPRTVISPQLNSVMIDRSTCALPPLTAPSKQLTSCSSKSPELRIGKQIVSKKSPPSPASLVSNIEQCLNEWVTLETLIFLCGEKQVKDSIIEKRGSVKEYSQLFNNARYEWDPKLNDRYEKICKRLSLMEMEDDIFDSDMQPTVKLKPLPNYRDIQEDGKTLELKVNAFYQGKMKYSENQTPDENTIDVAESVSEMMPLVDSHSQKALRRKLVIDRLKRVLSDWSSICGMPTNDIVTQVRAVVSTFSLAAHNITFKPLEWRILGLVIVEMLALKDPILKAKIDSKQGRKYQTPILASFHQEQNYTKKLIKSLIDLDNLLQLKRSNVTNL